MSYADELAGLNLRLITDPTRKDTVQRRIGEVEAAIAAEPKTVVVDAPEAAVADHSGVETATLPRAKRK